MGKYDTIKYKTNYNAPKSKPQRSSKNDNNRSRPSTETVAARSNSGFALFLGLIVLGSFLVYGAVDWNPNDDKGSVFSTWANSGDPDDDSSDILRIVTSSVKDIEGKTVSISGKVVIMFYFYIDCHYCNIMEPELESALENYPSSDIVVLAINVDWHKDSESSLLTWKNNLGVDWIVMYEDSSLTNNPISVTGTPKTLYFGASGNYVTEHGGYPGNPNVPGSAESEIIDAINQAI